MVSIAVDSGSYRRAAASSRHGNYADYNRVVSVSLVIRMLPFAFVRLPYTSSELRVYSDGGGWESTGTLFSFRNSIVFEFFRIFLLDSARLPDASWPICVPWGLVVASVCCSAQLFAWPIVSQFVAHTLPLDVYTIQTRAWQAGRQAGRQAPRAAANRDR